MKKLLFALLFMCAPCILPAVTMSQLDSEHKAGVLSYLDKAETALINSKSIQHPVVYQLVERILIGLRVEICKANSDIGETAHLACQMINGLYYLEEFYYDINLESEVPEYDEDSLKIIYKNIAQIWSSGGKGSFVFEHEEKAEDIKTVYCEKDPYIPFDEAKYLKKHNIQMGFDSITGAEFPDKCYPEYRNLAQTQKQKHFEKAKFYEAQAKEVLKKFPACEGKNYISFVSDLPVELGVYAYTKNKYVFIICMLRTVSKVCVKSWYYINRNFEVYMGLYNCAAQHMDKAILYHQWLESHPLILPASDSKDDSMKYYDDLFEANLKQIRKK